VTLLAVSLLFPGRPAVGLLLSVRLLFPGRLAVGLLLPVAGLLGARLRVARLLVAPLTESLGPVPVCPVSGPSERRLSVALLAGALLAICLLPVTLLPVPLLPVPLLAGALLPVPLLAGALLPVPLLAGGLLAGARLAVARLPVTLSGRPEAGGCPLAGGRSLTCVLRALAVPPGSARRGCLRGRPLLVAARWRGRPRRGLLLVAGVPWAW
jgi:hypothetical protein